MSKIKNPQHTKGFTLVELLVSIGLFSVVLTVALGAILTIADSNKKTRTLMSVMNNLNFAVDSMTRSFKAGEVYNIINVVYDSNKCFQTREQNYDASGTRLVAYCITNGRLTKSINGGTPVPLTSSDVEITNGRFEIFNAEVSATPPQQPQLVIVLEGEVKISEKIKSKFSIHTSVSQRLLNI